MTNWFSRTAMHSPHKQISHLTNKYLQGFGGREWGWGSGGGGVTANFISIKSEFWMENRRMKMSRRMSAGSKNVRGKKKEEWEEAGDWEIFETTQCLLSVCLISVAHLKTGEGLHCATIQWGFSIQSCRGTVSGETMLWSATGRQLIKVPLLTPVSCSTEWPIVWSGSHPNYFSHTQTLLASIAGLFIAACFTKLPFIPVFNSSLAFCSLPSLSSS